MTNTKTYNRHGVDQLLHDAVRVLASYDPDRASVRNAVGFNGRDGEFGHAMAEKPFEEITPNMAKAMRKMVTTYRVQLSRYGIDVEQIDMSKVGQPQQRAERPKQVPTVSLYGTVLHFRSEQNDPSVPMVRALPRRRWIPAPSYFWEIPLIMENVDGLRAMYKAGVQFTPQAVDALKILTGGGPNGKGGGGNAASLRDLATAKQGSLEVKGLGMQLFPFQQAGVEYMTRVKRALCADEMGLGKSAEALASLQHVGAFPALIVVPATLRLNWKKEAAMWLPGRTVTVLSGTKPTAFLHGDIVIINYDILYSWTEFLSLIPWKAIVCDEVHYCKEKKSRRSQAVKAIIKATAPQYRFFLTGTPLLNRPIELTNLLDLLGYLRPVFGGFMTFAKRYCNATQGRFGWDFTQANMALLPELNDRLRATCMVRRLKTDVLTELPAKQRADVPMDMDPKVLAAYKRAEADVISWLQATEGEGKADRALRAEQLVKINTLRQLAAKGKLKAITAWVDNFTGYDRKNDTWDEDGTKLVLFAHHHTVQDALQEAFPQAAYIRSDQSKASVEEHKARFQTDPACKLIICSLKAGGLGHTLTAASNVAIAELGWTPSDLTQAEDRTHRIGQKDAVTAWYLLAEGTIDGYMSRLVHAKQEVIDAAVDGKLPADADDQDSMLDAVIAHLRAQPVRR